MKTILSFCFFFLLSLTLRGQDKLEYPDSLKSIVLKIEPLSFIYNHISGGIEIPLPKNLFLDINLGVANVGINNDFNKSGGFVSKVGLKIPKSKGSPFSIFYLMPEIAFSTYRAEYYDTYPNYMLHKVQVNSTAGMLAFGYRHVNPISKFYYDGAIDLGVGWTNHQLYNNSQYNHSLSNNNSIREGERGSGFAMSMHFAIGFILTGKRK